MNNEFKGQIRIRTYVSKTLAIPNHQYHNVILLTWHLNTINNVFKTTLIVNMKMYYLGNVYKEIPMKIK